MDSLVDRVANQRAPKQLPPWNESRPICTVRPGFLLVIRPEMRGEAGGFKMVSPVFRSFQEQLHEPRELGFAPQSGPTRLFEDRRSSHCGAAYAFGLCRYAE